MKLAIIGYGKMGKEIEKFALTRGHKVILKVDKDNPDQLSSGELERADVALEFTTPDTAESNINACFRAGVPVVCGTTGWMERLGEVERMCKEMNQTFFYASNFSIGVNILFRLNSWLAGVMNRFPEYEPRLTEVHHIHKKDSPSGTAITLAEGITGNIDRKNNWINKESGQENLLSVISERKGEVPGTHVITYSSPLDVLEISHRALSRSVFASGAVMAAEFIAGKKGIFKMNDLLDI